MEQEYIDCDRHVESFEIETPTLQLLDLCDDAIEIILKNLNLEELVNCADTNKRFNRIAQSVYSQKFRNSVLWFGSKDFILFREITEKHIRFDITVLCFKIIRNFGRFIRTIQIGNVADENEEDELNKNSFRYKNLIEYVFEYCDDSLEEIKLIDFPFFKLNKPMKKLLKLDVFDHLLKWRNRTDYLESIKWMLNLRCFMLYMCNENGIPKALKNYIPTLEEVSLHLHSHSDVEAFIQFLQMNQQIKKLHLTLVIKLRDSEVLFSIANCSQIKELELSFLSRSGRLENVQNCRFKTVEVFSFNRESDGAVKDLTFDVLKELNYSSFDKISINSYFMDFALRHKKLKKIFFKDVFMNNANLYKIQDELTELEEIVFDDVKKPMSEVLREHFNRDWSMTEIRNNSKSVVKLQRNQINSTHTPLEFITKF